jgi:hypothetical protein
MAITSPVAFVNVTRTPVDDVSHTEVTVLVASVTVTVVRGPSTASIRPFNVLKSVLYGTVTGAFPGTTVSAKLPDVAVHVIN